MDNGTSGHHGGFWNRLGQFFGIEPEESLEKAIIDAREDGEVAPEQEKMLLAILRFNETKVQDSMTPRADIDCVPDDAPLKEVAQAVLDSGHSRLPVYQDNRDNIVGVVHAKDLLGCLENTRSLADPVSTIMREAFFVPETKSIPTLLQEFRLRKQHIAIALDEYGGTSGLITFEDVLEEIFGDIEDEHDKPAKDTITDLGGGVYEMSSRVELEDLAELGLRIESEDVDTIGGFVTMEAGHVPSVGETMTHEGWVFTILDADKKHVKKLRMTRRTPDAADESPRA